MKTAIPILLAIVLLATLVFALGAGGDGFGLWCRTWGPILGGYGMGWYARG